MQENYNIQSSTLANIYNGFISLLRFCLANIKRHLVLFIACIAITSGALYLKFNSGKRYYDISFTLSYEELARKIYGDRLAKINTLIDLEEYSKLQNYLGVNNTVASDLLSVKGKNILGEDLSEDMNLEKIPFIVMMRVKDTSYTTELQNGIVNFLETGTPYLVSKKAIKLEEVDNEIAFIDRQLAMMDSLKHKFNSSSFATGDLASDDKNQVSPPGTIYSFSYTLYKRKQELLRKKAMPNNLQIIDDAIVSKEIKKPLLLILLAGLIGGTILYTAIVGILIPVFRKQE